MTSPRVRDTLALIRIGRMKQRSARMQVMAKAEAAAPDGCPFCSAQGPTAALLEMLGAEIEPEDLSHEPKH